jgi:hypothetical protein
MNRARRLIVVLFTVVILLGTLAVLTPIEATAKRCQACPAQPWCGCTYNGHPRISCDPCCYSTGFGQICTS